MATTPPVDFLSHPNLVAIERAGIGHSFPIFETERDGAMAQVEAMMLRADAAKERYFFCFRFLDEPFLRVQTNLPIAHRPKRPDEYASTERQNPEDKVWRLIARQAWRFIFLVDVANWGYRGLYWLCLDNDLRGGVWVGYDSPSQTGNFQLEPDLADFLTALNDPDSDIRFVLYWIQLPLETQRRLNTFYTNGDEEELRQVVGAIALHENLAQQHEQLVYRNGFLCSDWMRKYVKIGPPPPRFSLPYPAPSLRFEMWGKHVRNYFGIHGDATLMRKHQWLRPMQPEIKVQCSQASHHERFEAGLFLHEWAKDKIPPGELEVLLTTN